MSSLWNILSVDKMMLELRRRAGQHLNLTVTEINGLLIERQAVPELLTMEKQALTDFVVSDSRVRRLAEQLVGENLAYQRLEQERIARQERLRQEAQDRLRRLKQKLEAAAPTGPADTNGVVHDVDRLLSNGNGGASRKDQAGKAEKARKDRERTAAMKGHNPAPPKFGFKAKKQVA